MILLNSRRKIIHLFMLFIITVSLIRINPVSVQAANPELHGLIVGTIDSNKEIVPKDTISRIEISSINGRLGATIAEIEVDRVKDSQKALGFADLDKRADRGWYFVDGNETLYWINRFGGNPNHILGGAANVYSSDVTIMNKPGYPSYKAYNLAELATASGGAGFTIGDNLVPDGTGGYISVGHFRTTPQPTGQVSADKTAYKVNEQVTISANATDYSYYDRGIVVWNLSVMNKTTGSGFRQFESNKVVTDTSGYLPPVNETSSPKPFPWNQTYTYTPAEPGVYEVSLTITDRHLRSRQGSPGMSVSTPYTYQFTVGDVPPAPDPDPDPDPEPPGSCKLTFMDLRLEEENNDRELSHVASGGDVITVDEGSTIIATANKPGTFKNNGVPMQSGSGDNRKVGITDAPRNGTFTISYKSDDGTECWEKTFDVDDGTGGVDRCPIISVKGSSLRSGETIEVSLGEELTFQAKYTNANGETGPAELKWDVIRPNGSVETLPGGYDEIGGRDRWVTYNSAKLTLPFGKGTEQHDVILEKGKTYKLRLNYSDTRWLNRPECDWEITISVRDASCTITEQNNIDFWVYGKLPNPYPPGGEKLDSSGLSKEIYLKFFTDNGNGYDANMGLAAEMAGTWYIKWNGKRTALTGKLVAMERFDLFLPADVDVGDEIVLEFVSDTGCVRELSFTIMSDKKCANLLMSMNLTNGQQKWSQEIKYGETVQLDASDWEGGYHLEMFTDDDSNFLVYWLNPDTQSWTRNDKKGERLSSSSRAKNRHTINFPKDEATGLRDEGFYMVRVWDEDEETQQCDGHYFVQIGQAQKGENLLIVKSSFSITPKDPQAPGTPATITFQVKNAGVLEHDTKLAVRWESAAKETMLDVDDFKPGEVRKITVPTQYPQQSENFIANINPSKNSPADETVWADNRSLWPVKVVGGNAPGGGEDWDGGEIGLEIYDSDNRQLQKLQVNADGVWEREPARIRVVIDQTKINEGFQQTQQKINQKINDYKAALEQSVSGEGVKNVSVTAWPGWIADAKSMAVYNPAMLDLKVSGPGVPQQWQVSSSSTGGDYLYQGTSVPTQTTWRQVLNAQKYKAEINGFVIVMDYSIQFDVSFDNCSTDEDGNETCEPHSLTETMTGRYTITVKGSERTFEVFEPNAAASIRHTAEWSEYHARDRYPNSQSHDFYAGERILAQTELQARHRHPVSGQYPVILSVQAWIFETGRRQTALQSKLSLQSASPQLWRGPSYSASKLGFREAGVDTSLMGDKQRGFQKDATYAVYYDVQFRFGVNKGFPYANKTAGIGHDITDYRIPFRIIANAWERQGIRNHSTQ